MDELALAVNATYVASCAIGSGWALAASNDRIAIELAALGLWRLREMDIGVEAEGPWEDIGVQRLAEVEGGVAVASDLTVRAGVRDNAGAVAAARLTELLGCRLELEWAGSADG